MHFFSAALWFVIYSAETDLYQNSTLDLIAKSRCQMRILIAEDDKVSQTIISAFLTKQGFDVTCVDSGEDAWSQYQRKPFRIVITDWKMSGMSGLELSRRIREASPDAYTYIIMLTANTNSISGFAAGADDFVRKPFDADELLLRVKAGIRVLELEDHLHQQILLVRESEAKLAEAHKKLEAELSAASDLQRSLLPKHLPPTEAIRFAWSFEPSTALGGDSFNVQKLAEDRYALMMTDVCGHGVKPALLAVALHYVLDPGFGHSPMLWTDKSIDDRLRVVPPTEVLARLNRQFPMETEAGQYFTMLYGVLETDTGNFRYSTAGHPTPILIPVDGKACELPGTGVPIGLHSKPDFDSETVSLKPGDRLLVFSDGLVESKRSDGERIGTDRLITWIQEYKQMNISEITASLVKEVKAWNSGNRPSDDVSMLMVEFTGKAAAEQLIAKTLLKNPMASTWR